MLAQLHAAERQAFEVREGCQNGIPRWRVCAPGGMGGGADYPGGWGRGLANSGKAWVGGVGDG